MGGLKKWRTNEKSGGPPLWIDRMRSWVSHFFLAEAAVQGKFPLLCLLKYLKETWGENGTGGRKVGRRGKKTKQLARGAQNGRAIEPDWGVLGTGGGGEREKGKGEGGGGKREKKQFLKIKGLLSVKLVSKNKEVYTRIQILHLFLSGALGMSDVSEFFPRGGPKTRDPRRTAQF